MFQTKVREKIKTHIFAQ